MIFTPKPFMTFYEKPGCGGNKRQKEALKANGVRFVEKNILTTQWDKATLLSFFGDKPITECINDSFKLDLTDTDEILEAMIANPMLIKRPLMEIGDTKITGFDVPRLNALLNINIDPANPFACLGHDKCNSH